VWRYRFSLAENSGERRRLVRHWWDDEGQDGCIMQDLSCKGRVYLFYLQKISDVSQLTRQQLFEAPIPCAFSSTILFSCLAKASRVCYPALAIIIAHLLLSPHHRLRDYLHNDPSHI
jgi:hypothetical protein